ncbi:uncharacterized protein LOC103314849 [Tribolium castaneum]|uniref:DUF4729 domain-containing protein n=1 Tax=Tribolium castaneum TaxID=7070 RepID=D6WTZ5_TRICA|nr:PREDICTED: uncharacterized protein LOC103314849 [Tribolium castaneum]EFA07351.1 hypothetical protein TcasGA2_TC015951 [Tribolium castaneum]|eukprot:XP_008200158.1 PREDICTED: uncharacterized protein LOC103314849 [Tribolium castaneum]
MKLCSICGQKFKKSELLQSSDDEYFCKECFKLEYCAVSAKKKPPVANKYEGDLAKTPTVMFPLDELARIRRNREIKRNTVPSKRPLQCPHIHCNRYVSIYDLNAHFQHEHMEVPIAETALDARNPLTFHPKDIRYGVKQCLILLNVVPQNDDTENTGSQKPSLPVTVAVLISRIASAQLGDEEEMLMQEENSGMVSGNNDKIIIWTASNVLCDYSYTVAVSTVTENVRVKHYGPILQLGGSTKTLCMEGQCLILSHFHFMGMSENGIRPLRLDVIIHSED